MSVSRRYVLRGLGGAALSLPLLEGLLPRQARARAEPATFAVFFRQANGVAAEQSSPLSSQREPERFWPSFAGPLTPQTLAGRALDELGAVSSKLLVVGGVDMEDFDYGDGHARGALQGLTAQGPTQRGAGGDSEAAGESIDHRIGRELNPGGRDSLFLCAGKGGGWLGGPCISYRASGRRRAAMRNPLSAYQTVSGLGSQPSEQAAQLVAMRQRSINDLVREQMQALMARPELSTSDRQRLELHFNSIREIELGLACRLSEQDQRLLDGAGAIYDSIDGDEVLQTARLHMNIVALAIACGYTRSAAIQVGAGNDGRTKYRDPDTGQLMENYHYVSHRRLSHDSSGSVIRNSDILHHKIDRQFAQTFRHLIERLSAYAMPDGSTLLDHGVAVWYNDNGNGPGHSPRNVPFILAGSCKGTLKQGQFIKLPDSGGSNHARLLNTIGNAVGLRTPSGAPIDDFGDSTLAKAPLGELLV